MTISEGRKTGEFDPRVDSKDTIAAAAVPRSTVRRSAESEKRPGRLARFLGFREVGLLGFIVLLAAVMAWFKPAEFATVQNFLDVLSNAALPAIVAQGAMLIICAGGIDISVGSMIGLVSAVATSAAVQGLPPVLALGLGMALGMVFSLLNGGVALSARIHPIIVTLAGISIYRGFMRIAMGGKEIMGLPPAYRALVDGNLFGVPKICYYVIVVTLLIHVFLRYTLSGRRVLALGNSESAARLIGLSKTRLTLLVFGISGALVGLVAVPERGVLRRVQANTGEGMELKAIAAAVIGGTNILGGTRVGAGDLARAFLVALLYNTLVLAQVSPYWQSSFVGALILAAVILDSVMQRSRGGKA